MFNSGIRGKRATDNQGTLNPQNKFIQTVYPQPYISGYAVSGSDDTALDPAGGQTVLVNGTGFATGVSATLAGTQIASVTLVSSTQISFTAPAKAGGSYSLLVYNSTGAAAILVPGLTYSSVPTYTTAAGSIGTYYETTAISTSVLATSDSAITYSLSSGSLPSGATLYGNGVITGTSPIDSSSTTYTFDITATDAELQDVTRTFTLTINTDVVSWSTPASGASYILTGNSPISNVALSATSAAGYGVTYAANALPTGLSLSGSTISGTPTVEQTVSTLLTATANTSSRTSTRTVSWSVIFGDSYWKYTSLLLSATTPTTTFINDASLNNFQLTIQGDTKPSKFNPYTLGYYSNYFDGTGDYLDIASGAALQIGSSDFTIEGWFYPTTAANYNELFAFDNATSAGYSAIRCRMNSSRQLELYLSTNGSGWASSGTSSGTLTLNFWNHVAVVRNGSSSNNITVYINGQSAGLALTFSGSGYTTAGLKYSIGAVWSSSAATEFWQGYISNFRMVKGTAVYTTTFTPSTTPLTAIANTSLLTCQSSRLIDNSTNNFTITKNGDTTISPANPFPANSSYNSYGSHYFSAISAYSTLSMGASQAFGTGDFTVECWFNPTSSTACNIIMVATTTASWQLLTYANQLYWQENGGNLGGAGYGSIPLNAWSHLAISRASSVLKMFINGVQVYSAANTYDYSNSTTVRRIGPSDGGNVPFYVSDFRVVKGTGVYTAAFTPPTSPLTAITNTQLLTCQYNGGATNNGFIDQSSFNNVITKNGNTQQGTFSPYSQNGWSNYFNGSSSYVTSASNTTNALGSGDYTIEFWCFPQSLGSGSAGCMFYVDMGGYQQLMRFNGVWECYYKSGSAFTTISITTLPLNQWVHQALVRSSGTVKWYINGVQQGSASDSTNYSSSTYFQMGMFSSYYYDGYISNARVVKGTAVYTSAFTPPTSPLTAISGTIFLTAQSYRFIDNGPNNLALTLSGTPQIQAYSPFGGVTSTPISYSNYFDGTGDYLTLSNNTLLGMGSGNFTIEFWMYQTALSNYRQILDVLDGNSVGRLILWVGSDGTLTNLGQSGNQRHSTASGAIVINTWTHVALVRSSGTTKFYINGTQSGSNYTDSTNYTCTTGTVYIGINSDGSTYPYIGYLSNFRMVKGTAVYTSNFTPPTTSLTAIANTSLLTCQSQTMIDNSSNYFTITANGDTKPTIFNPFGITNTTGVAYTPSVNGGSMYFDGSGDYLNLPTNTLFGFSNGDFTINFWAYPTVNARQDWVDLTDGTTRVLVYYSGSAITFYSYPGAAVITGPAMVLNTWQHIALSKSSGSSRLFVDGVQVGSTYATNQTYFTTATVTIGKDSVGSTYVTGYMSDIRIITGTGIYTSNFVPPLTPLTNTTTIGTRIYNPSLLINATSGGIIDYHGTNDLETVGNTQLAPQDPYGGSYYSNYFDGSGDYLTTATVPSFGTSDFTIEGWVYNTGTVTNSGVFQLYTTAFGGLNGIALAYYTAGGGITTYYGSGTQVNGTITLTTGTWYHFAITRSGTSLKTFINGTVISTATDSTNYALTTLTLGGYYSSSYLLTGYISNFRIVNGTALYTSAFTPPTGPLTAVSGTSVLTCQSNSLKDNSTNALTITRTGDVSVKSVNPFQQNTGKSIYFDGTGDSLKVIDNPNINLGSGDFTLECWVYFNAVNIQVTVINKGWNSSSAYASYLIWMQNDATLRFLASSNGGSWDIASEKVIGTMTSGSWIHIAVTRNGSTFRAFVNGVINNSFTFTSSLALANIAAQTLFIGDRINGDTSMNGYMRDVRITKGIARYTTTFTPPTSPVPAN